MWPLILANVTFFIAFVILLIDVYYTSRLFRAPQGNVVTKSEIPAPNEARVFRAHIVSCTYDAAQRAMFLVLTQDPHTDMLVDYMGDGAVLCVLDGYLFSIRLVSKIGNKINIKVSQVEGMPVCFTQLTAYGNVNARYAGELNGTTLIMLCHAH